MAYPPSFVCITEEAPALKSYPKVLLHSLSPKESIFNNTERKSELKNRQKTLMESLIKISDELIRIKSEELHRDMDTQIQLLEIKRKLRLGLD